MSGLHVTESVDGEPVARELRPLLEAVYAEIAQQPSDLRALKTALMTLLEFLASPAGKTNANCWAADLFFCLRDDWAVDWEHLPETFGDVLGDLGGALHDAVQDRATAENFDSTPEQLLARVRGIEISERVV